MRVSLRRFILDGLGQAIQALHYNRLRTLLSVLGITVGIAGVMAVGTISKSGRYLIFSELQTFGLKSVWVYRTNDDKDPNRAVRAGTGIEARDVEVLTNCCLTVRHLSPIVFGSGAHLLVHAGKRFSNPQLTGVGADYAIVNNEELREGRFFKAYEVLHRRDVAVIGVTAAQDLFGADVDPVGREIRIGDRPYLVIGLLENKDRSFIGSLGSPGGIDANNRILLPYTTLQAQIGTKDVGVIQAEAADVSKADAAVDELIQVLEREHNHRYAYKSTTMAQYIKVSDRILQGVSLIGIIAASISLLVGGLGIMNIVSTSVQERTREIGLRKAVGANQRSILFQFLMESVIISASGGLFGLILGVGGSVILALVTGFPLMPSWPVVVLALVTSILVGLLSGYLPARRAAHLRPVLALRYE